MALPLLTCAQCGTQVTIPQKYSSVRKYCNLCQVVRETADRLPKARNCERCGTQFWPIRSSRLWNKCGRCTSRLTLEQRMNAPECNVCGEKVPPAEGLTETCLPCVQSHEHYRDSYVARVNEIVANRAKTFASQTVNPDLSVV